MEEQIIDIIEEPTEETIPVEEENVIVNTGGTQNYNDLYNKPQINNIELIGNKSLSDLGIDQDFVKDNNYVHTDNNYTTNEKTKLASLENYDDTEIKADISGLNSALSTKQNKTTITTDTSSSTVSLTPLSNNEYRYTQELSTLTLTLPTTIDNDYISFIVFASGSTATTITYDSSIKWSGDDITSGSFVPSASKTYNIVFWYDGININAIARSV